MEELKYPIGRFKYSGPQTPEQRLKCIDEIDAAPRALRLAVAGLSEKDLHETYRKDGWTLRQVVHHVADSHMHAYQRFKFALTEEHPSIRSYQEALWAEELDARTLPVEVSLNLLEALHQRWGTRLRSMEAQAFSRTLDHPEMGSVSLDQMLALYAWHGRHHTAHIVEWRKRNANATPVNMLRDRFDQGRRVTVDEIKVQFLPGQRFAAAFRHGSLEVELYAPRGTDPQHPHARDEAYVVVSGRGEFISDAGRQSFGPGDFLFAPAGVEHRFERFSDDLVVWVLFYGPQGGELSHNSK